MIKSPKVINAFSVVALFLIFANNICYGQQTPVFPEYNYNPFIVNSAYAGFLDEGEITLAGSGFLGAIEGSPETVGLSFHSPLRDGIMGLGGAVIRDQIGVTTTTSAYGAYSYRIFFDFKENRPYWQIYQKPSLSFGLTAGMQQFQDNLLELGISNDPTFASNVNATLPLVGIGILFNKANFYAGVSTPNILGSRFSSDDRVDLKSVYYGNFGYRFFPNGDDILLKPSMLVKYENGSPLQADINMSLSLRDKLEVGVGYRTNSSINVLAGFYLFDSFRFIYTYNIASKDLTIGNTHGLILSFQFNRGYSID
ncbi:PorP/SprF family type IX secretion system membrane protein [Zobellia laminariae]|uniref:PorP/SprF family type IX secretion system membrane protein n=1 Tax=Zobellia laminariae TaxID=248906 RepID=UPI0026F455D1|nr:PorP/SprF family type IX secretion system membrane protein [Zobellia laminariae]WKX74802.1 PorP/SprF family type IX secretion system membrane protein [Zobellia laminariae]